MLVAMEMGERGLGVPVSPPETATALLESTPFKKAWSTETALRLPCLPVMSLCLISKTPPPPPTPGSRRPRLRRRAVLAQSQADVLMECMLGMGRT